MSSYCNRHDETVLGECFRFTIRSAALVYHCTPKPPFFVSACARAEALLPLLAQPRRLSLVERTETAHWSSACLPCVASVNEQNGLLPIMSGTRLSAARNELQECATSQIQPIRCFKTSETGTTGRQFSSDPQPPATTLRCDHMSR